MYKPKSEIAKKIMSGKLNRRQVMQAMGAAGLVATTQFGASNVFAAVSLGGQLAQIYHPHPLIFDL